jgi:ABC-type iron transport system FetAB ATPase subunit
MRNPPRSWSGPSGAWRTRGTVVWVTHDEQQAARLGDRRVRIEDGRIVD